MAASSHPDSGSPWVFSVKDIVRLTGQMREVEETRPAPEGLSLPLMGVPAGSEIELGLRLESVHEGILVTGTAGMDLRGECSRCLDELHEELVVDLQELFLTEPAPGEEEEQALVDHDTVDLEPVLRDAVVTALPFQPVCRPDCPGLCADCGIRLEDAPEGHAHEKLDPRWAALAALKEDPTTVTTETEER